MECLLEAEQELGATFTWPVAAAGADPAAGAASYPCVGGAQFGGRRLDLGGYVQNADVTIVARLEVFGDGPTPGEKQTLAFSQDGVMDGVRLRVESVTVWRRMLVLGCNDPNRGS